MGSREAAFERIYDESFERVAAYLVARTDRECAADVLAKTFEVVWRRLADVPPDPVPWLIGVARNVLSETRRGDRRRTGLLERLATDATRASARDPSDVVIDRDRARAALVQLRPSEREALLLVAWDGLSNDDAARVVGCSPGAFAVRRSRARARLDAAMQEPHDHPATRETR